MNLLYQWVPWAYSNLACLKAKEILNIEVNNILWLPDFTTVRSKMDSHNIWVLPVENSYAWNIHENLYNFLRSDFTIIWEINLNVNHCLLSNEKNIKDIKKVYSHTQALSQCHDFLKKNNIKAVEFWDTAWAAQMISLDKTAGVWALASSLAWEIYDLNIIKEWIQDQNGNTTRFIIVAQKDSGISIKEKSWKISVIFETRNLPANLYKCLWAFATNNVNLTKIESMPSLKNPFTYMFWLDFEWKLSDENVKKSLEELDFFTNFYKILWEY